MITSYDFFGNAEIPQVILCNPNKEPLYSLSSYFYDEDMSKFADKIKNEHGDLGKEVKEAMSMYDQIKYKKQLFDDYIKCITGA